MGPLLTLPLHDSLQHAAHTGLPELTCSVDLGRSSTTVTISPEAWHWQGASFPYLETCRDRSIYHWIDGTFQPVARFATSLVKLVATRHGPPTFEIDGIKMLPSAHVSPYADAERKVDLIRPQGKLILDTCGGLGYFAAWCLQRQAGKVLSYEKNADVMWLRSLNPWSPQPHERLCLMQTDIVEGIRLLADRSIDAILHDPPRFGIAGELYSQAFYQQLSRVIRDKGRLFHYTGTPNKLTSGRDVPAEVARRLQRAGFATSFNGDGVLAVKR